MTRPPSRSEVERVARGWPVLRAGGQQSGTGILLEGALHFPSLRRYIQVLTVTST